MRSDAAARAAVLSGEEGFSAAFSLAGSGEDRFPDAIFCFGFAAGSSTSPANASSDRLTREVRG